MTDLKHQIAALSAEKRALLEQWLIREATRGTENRAIPRRGTTAPAPLSFAQQRLWFIDQLEPENPVYNMVKAVRLNGPLQQTMLQKALETIVARHEALRTIFVSEEDHPAQIVTEYRPLALEIVDLRAWPEVNREAELHRLLTAAVQRPFNLSQDLMLRATLFQMNTHEHVLVIVVHHIACDGWSMGILWHELSVLYTAFSSGKPPQLQDLPIQYADYTVWQQEWLQGDVITQQLHYWKKQMEGAPLVLNLPFAHPRPAVQSYQGAREAFSLSPELSAALKTFSQREGATLFMTVLAAFQTLLYRYTGQEDLVVGSPIAGRTRPETEALIGVFINTLVLRTGLSGNPTFRELLKRVQKVALEAYGHQDVPFEKLVEELQPQRSLSHSPLFQVMVALYNGPSTELTIPNLSVSPVNVQRETATFDLALSLQEEENLNGWLVYNTDLFEVSTIKRMVEHLRLLLEGIVVHPEQRLSELPLLTPVERHQLLVEWNNTQKHYLRDKSVHQLFEAQVEQTPNAVAVIHEDQPLTYRELNTRANQLAHYLQQLGVGPEVLVAICVERSVEMIVGLLGILKAGGAYVPLDPSYPRERLAFTLADSQAPVILTQQKLSDALPSHHAHAICLDRDWNIISRASAANPAVPTIAEHLAYVLYTSGSTGHPKGVQISHGALSNFVTAMQEHPGMAATDLLLAVTTLSFDIAALELFLPLTVGARVIVASRDVAIDGAALARTLNQHRVTIMQATPATWRMLVEAGWRGSPHFKILCGGEALPQDLAAQLLTCCGQLWNLYGPTETTIWSALHRVESAAGTVPIGRPIANTQLYILDAHLNPVPLGVVGELYIGGAGLARGYLNRPELTAEKFIICSFAGEPAQRLYKTGDLARYLPDGTIEFLGRVDNQVKVRGFRIELGEIEAVLAQHPDIREAVVLMREDSPGDKRLVAYVGSRESSMRNLQPLRTYLQHKLPNYMIPSTFVFMDTLPLTPNGKIDRKALLRPEHPRPVLAEQYLPAHTPTEQLLAEVWAAVLKVERVGVHDNFFELGGHSLLATMVISRINQRVPIAVSLRSLFEFPTVATLAQLITEQQEQLVSDAPLDRILSDIEALSEEEADKLLGAKA